MIRVLIAEGSLIRANLLARALKDGGVAESVGIARNGEEAVVLAHRLKPDVILMDVHVPVLQAPLATRQIMDHSPSPILLIAEPGSADRATFVALDEGAVGIISRPRLDRMQGSIAEPRWLAKRVELVARAATDTMRLRAARSTPLPARARREDPLLLIGGATGGIQATMDVLRRLPASFSSSICLVQHLEPRFLEGYRGWLESQTEFRVEVCGGKRPLVPGTIYMAKPGAHLVLHGPETVAAIPGRSVGGHRPSITVLYRSAATHRPKSCCALVLAGEGRDGVEGVKRLARSGGRVVVQKRETCLVAEMPAHALRAHRVALELSPPEMADWLVEDRAQGASRGL